MVKDKPNSTRIYDEEGYRKRAACVCVKESDHDQILLVTSSNEPKGWIVPGGGLEPAEQPSETAMREVLEEAGVSGRLGPLLGIFENNERKHRTVVYVLYVTDELVEWDDSKTIGRRRQWFSFDEALLHLSTHKPLQSPYLLRFQQLRKEQEMPR